MSKVAPPTHKLPRTILTRADVNRCMREIEAVESFMSDSAVRKSGTNSIQTPKLSKMLDDFCVLNGLNLLQLADRQAITITFKYLRDHAPVLHYSFASEPMPDFTQKITDWSREKIDPFALIQIGLSPSVIMGCRLRSTNKIFDMSLRKAFEREKHQLAEAIKNLAAS